MSNGAVEREVWIGLVEVAADEGNDIFGGGLGAYANVLALAGSVEDYMAVTATALTRQRLIAVGLDDPEPLRDRQLREQLTDEIIELGERAKNGDVVWDTFYVFDSDEDEE
jgi:hypothetical protein